MFLLEESDYGKIIGATPAKKEQREKTATQTFRTQQHEEKNLVIIVSGHGLGTAVYG